MANRNTPFGFKPVGHLNGSAWNGATEIMEFPAGDATAVYVGDAVISYKLPSDVYRAATVATTHADIAGVVVGFKPDPAISQSTIHKAASIKRLGYVVTDRTVVYEVQEDSDANYITLAMIGSNGDLVATAGDSTTGNSKQTLDSSDVSAQNTTAATNQFRVVGFVNRPDNAVGNYAKWLVIINEHGDADGQIGAPSA